MNISSFFKELWQNILSLKSKSAWFEPTYMGLNALDWVLGAIALVSLMAGAVFWRLQKKTANPIRKKYLRRWQNLSVWFGILGLLWLGARYQYVGFFGTLAFFAFLLLLASLQKIRILTYACGKMKREKKAWEARQQKLKYLS